MKPWFTARLRYILPPLPPARFSCFQYLSLQQILHQADFTIPVEIEGNYHNVYVIKRPGVDQFMKRVGELYEVVVFTASVSKVCFDQSEWSDNFLTLRYSTAIRCWINSTSMALYTIVFSGRVATITVAIMSRIFRKLGET